MEAVKAGKWSLNQHDGKCHMFVLFRCPVCRTQNRATFDSVEEPQSALLKCEQCGQQSNVEPYRHNNTHPVVMAA